MKRLKPIILLLILMTGFLGSYGQSASDTIQIIKSKQVIYYKQHGEVLRFKKLYQILSQNPDSYLEINKAKRARIESNLLSWPGSILCGLFIEGLLKGHVQNAIPVVGGIGLIVFTIPLNKAKIEHMDRAVMLYNRALLKN